MHSQTKHRDIKHHFLHDYIHQRDAEVTFVDAHNQLADIFTIPLPKNLFTKFSANWESWMNRTYDYSQVFIYHQLKVHVCFKLFYKLSKFKILVHMFLPHSFMCLNFY